MIIHLSLWGLKSAKLCTHGDKIKLFSTIYFQLQTKHDLVSTTGKFCLKISKDVNLMHQKI